MAEFSTELDPFFTALLAAMALETATPSSIKANYGNDTKWAKELLARALAETIDALGDNAELTKDEVLAAFKFNRDWIGKRAFEILEKSSTAVQSA